MKYEFTKEEREKLDKARKILEHNKAVRANLIQVKMTKSAERDIQMAIAELSEEDRDDARKICSKVCQMNFEKFVGANGSEDGYVYQMNRKGFVTTNDVMDCIAQYQRKHADLY